MTGCSSVEAGGAAVGVGLVTVAGGWAAYRYLSRIRGETASSAPPAVALAGRTVSRTSDATRADIPQAALVAIRGEIERIYPVLAEDTYAALTLAIARTILKSRPSNGPDSGGPSLENIIRDQVASLIQQLRARPNAAPTERLLRELEKATGIEAPETNEDLRDLFNAVASNRNLMTPQLVARVSDELRRQTDSVAGAWCCHLLLRVALSLPKEPIAGQAVEALSTIGLSHPVDAIAQKAAGTLEELAQHGSLDADLQNIVEFIDPKERGLLRNGRMNFGDLKAQYGRLITPDVVDRLRTNGLTDRGVHFALKTVWALKTIGLLEEETESSQKAIEALSMEGIYHPHMSVAVMAAEGLAQIANKDHSRIPMLPLVGLRLRGFAKDAPRELATAFIDTLSRIANPWGTVPSKDRAVSEQALRILFEDGLSHPDPEIAAGVRRRLQAILSYRPELFSDEMRETMKP